ncbi:Uncharacterised protein [Mycobacteroides abscessus subsp. abscessus]|nr:Uncharacterised protein [Mycobacteroides abscessus subsp. abscessus]
MRRSFLPSLLLDMRDPVEGPITCRGQLLVHLGGIVADDYSRVMTVSGQKRREILFGDAGQYRRVGDLVAIEMQDG